MIAEMKAALIKEYGSNDVVAIEEIDRPEPAAGQILVKVYAAGVNPVDWKIRGGAGQRMGMTLPIHLGGEFVGTVEQLGSGVIGFETGEAIYGMVHTGAFSEYVVVKAENMARVPLNLDIEKAAALPLSGTTAWQAMYDKAGLAAGQRLFITNGSGSVGSLAVQFAKATGAHITAMASGRNEELVRSLGADEFIDYKTQTFEQIVQDMDVVFDTVGGETFQRAFHTLKKNGAMVTIVAFPADEAERFGVRVERSFTVPNATALEAITQLVEAGKVVPQIDSVFPFADIKQALELSESGRARGKIILRIAE
jgi:NADPH:quinone reductase-like Zn-dependent oxidoreductase